MRAIKRRTLRAISKSRRAPRIYCLRSRLGGVATVIASLLLAAQTAAAEPPRLTPDELDAIPVGQNGAGTSGVSTLRTTVVSGDPTKPGLYTIRISVPPHTAIQPHTHRDDRTATVASGIWMIGYGDHRDPAKLKILPAGSFYVEPAGASHFAGTGESAAVVFITGVGPSDTRYVATASQ